MGICGPFSWYAGDIHVHRSMKSSSFFRVCVCFFLRNYYCQQYAHADLTNLVQYSRMFEKKKGHKQGKQVKYINASLENLFEGLMVLFFLLRLSVNSFEKTGVDIKQKKRKERGGLRN